MDLWKNCKIAVLAVAVVMSVTSYGCSRSNEAVAPKVDTPLPKIESAPAGAGGASKTNSTRTTVPAS